MQLLKIIKNIFLHFFDIFQTQIILQISYPYFTSVHIGPLLDGLPKYSIKFIIISRKMDSEIVTSLFNQSTQMYRQGNHAVCLALLNDCIILEPTRSLLYSNRAIAHFHLKEQHKSHADLETSLKINHLNYIAYFNLFSLHMINNNSQLAFKKLCLCLSSVHTHIARHNKSMESVKQAISYAFNNKEAIFMRAMNELQNSQLTASAASLRAVAELQQYKENKHKIVSILHQLQRSINQPISIFQSHIENSYYILKTNLAYPGSSNIQEIINEMLKEFNNLYNIINQQNNAWRYKSISIEKQSDVSFDKSALDMSHNRDSKQCNRITAYNSIATFQNSSSENQKDQDSNKNIQFLYSNLKDQKLLNIHSGVKQEKSGFKNNQSSINSYGSRINSYNIYPLKTEQQKIKILVQSAVINSQFMSRKKELTSVYAIFNYNQNQNSSKVRTSITKCHQYRCKWQQWSELLQLSQQPSKLKFKIYNKSYTHYHDQFIGQGEFQLNSLGFVKVGFFNRKGQENGQIELTIQLSN